MAIAIADPMAVQSWWGYDEVMKKYGSDKPDFRTDKNDPNLLAFAWVVDFPFFEKTGEDNVDGTGEWTFTHNPFSRPKDEHMDLLMKKESIFNAMNLSLVGKNLFFFADHTLYFSLNIAKFRLTK